MWSAGSALQRVVPTDGYARRIHGGVERDSLAFANIKACGQCASNE